MKIWITEIGEPLPHEIEARPHRYGVLSKNLARLGHDVTLWTSNFSHAKKCAIVPADSVDHIDGVEVRVIKGLGYRRNISIQRIRHQAHFAKRFAEEAPRLKKPDVIVTPIPTLEVAAEAIRFGQNRDLPVVVDVRDCWPDEFVDLTPRPARPLARLLLRPYFKSAREIFKHAASIVGVSESYMKYGIAFAGRDFDAARDTVLPIGYPLSVEQLHLTASDQEWLARVGASEDVFTIVFFGTIGRFFNLETVMTCARNLQDQKNLRFVLCGDGSSLKRYQRMANDLPNVSFPGWVNQRQINALMARASAGIAPYSETARMALPNKPFEYMAGRLPILSSITGELATLIDEHQCGLNYVANDGLDLTAKVERLVDAPAEAKAMGERAFELLSQRFTSEIVGRKWAEHLSLVTR